MHRNNKTMHLNFMASGMFAGACAHRTYDDVAQHGGHLGGHTLPALEAYHTIFVLVSFPRPRERLKTLASQNFGKTKMLDNTSLIRHFGV